MRLEMIKGLGIDLLDRRRIDKAIQKYNDRFASRILSKKEFLLYKESSNQVRYLSNCYCVKEAVSKALGTGIGKMLSFNDMSILRDEKGAPHVEFSQSAEKFLSNREIHSCLISLSDEEPYVTAVAILS